MEGDGERKKGGGVKEGGESSRPFISSVWPRVRAMVK